MQVSLETTPSSGSRHVETHYESNNEEMFTNGTWIATVIDLSPGTRYNVTVRSVFTDETRQYASMPSSIVVVVTASSKFYMYIKYSCNYNNQNNTFIIMPSAIIHLTENLKKEVVLN